MPFEIASIRELAGLQLLQEEWNALQQHSSARGAALDWHTITIWWKHFGHEGKLWILTARDAEHRLVGIAPLMCRRFQPKIGFAWRQIEFIGSMHHHEHLDFIIEPGLEESIVPLFIRYLAQQRQHWDVLHLSALADTPTLELLKSEGDWLQDIDEPMISPTIALPATPEDWLKSLSRNRRWKLKRQQRQLDEDFPDRWSVQVLNDPQQLDSMLDLLVSLHQERRTALGDAGAFANPALIAYYRELMHCYLEQGWLRFYTFTLDGKIPVALYAYHYRERAYNEIVGFDDTLTEIPIGHVLTAFSIEQAINQGANEYTLMWGQEPYKYSFGAEDRVQHNLTWFAAPGARMQHSILQVLRQAKARLRQLRAANKAGESERGDPLANLES